MSDGKTGQVAVVILVLSALFAFLIFLPSPVRENSPDQADTQPPPPGSCVVTQVTDVTEFLEMASSSGAGFRYSGAPLAVTLDIHIQTIAREDWNDDDKRKETRRNRHEDNQVLAYSSCPANRIEAFESGRMGDEEKAIHGLEQQGKLLLQFPVKWWSSRNHTSLILNSTAVMLNETRTGGTGLRTSLADKFPDPDAIANMVLGGGASPFIEESVVIAPGETVLLFDYYGHVSFGDNSDGPVFLMTCSLRAQCLRPPAGTAPEAK